MFDIIKSFKCLLFKIDPLKKFKFILVQKEFTSGNLLLQIKVQMLKMRFCTRIQDQWPSGGFELECKTEIVLLNFFKHQALPFSICFNANWLEI